MAGILWFKNLIPNLESQNSLELLEPLDSETLDFLESLESLEFLMSSESPKPLQSL